MPCYDLVCTNEKCREKIPEAIVPEYAEAGAVVKHPPCPKCGKPMRRSRIEVPAHLPGCWAGKFHMQDL